MLFSLTTPTLPCGAVERPAWRESSTSWSWSTYNLLLCSGVSPCVCACVFVHACEIMKRDHTLRMQSLLEVCELHSKFYKFVNIKSLFNQNVILSVQYEVNEMREV